jgi:hypothetical protein
VRFSMSPWESFFVSRSRRMRSPIIMARIVAWSSYCRKTKLTRTEFFLV